MKQAKTRAAGRIPAKETAVFCTQASLLLKAGVPLGEGLKTLTDEGTPQGKDLLRRIAEKVEEPGSLYEGVREAEAFPSYMVQMIRIGERVGKLEEVLEQGCEDYVTVILTDKVDLDVIDMQDRLRLAFPKLLEIRREGLRNAVTEMHIEEQKFLDPFELCCAFLQDTDEAEKELLMDVIHTVQEVK